MNGKEILNMETLNQAYQKRMQMLHEYTRASIKSNSQTGNFKSRKIFIQAEINKNIEVVKLQNLVEMLKKSKRENLNFLDFLKENFTIEEVAL